MPYKHAKHWWYGPGLAMSIALVVALLMLLAWAWVGWAADVAFFDRTVAVTDAGLTVIIDYDGNGSADNTSLLCLTNDGPGAVVHSFTASVTWHATNHAALTVGESVCFSRQSAATKFTRVSFDTDTGQTASVRIRAFP